MPALNVTSISSGGGESPERVSVGAKRSLVLRWSSAAASSPTAASSASFRGRPGGHARNRGTLTVGVLRLLPLLPLILGALTTQWFVDQALVGQRTTLQRQWRQRWKLNTQAYVDRIGDIHQDLAITRHLISVRAMQQGVAPAEVVTDLDEVLALMGVDATGEPDPDFVGTLFAQSFAARDRAAAEASLTAAHGSNYSFSTLGLAGSALGLRLGNAPLPTAADPEHRHIIITAQTPHHTWRDSVADLDTISLDIDSFVPDASVRGSTFNHYAALNIPLVTRPVLPLPTRLFDSRAAPTDKFNSIILGLPVYRYDVAARNAAPRIGLVSPPATADDREAQSIGVVGIFFNMDIMFRELFETALHEGRERGTALRFEAVEYTTLDGIGRGVPAWTGGWPAFESDVPPTADADGDGRTDASHVDLRGLAMGDAPAFPAPCTTASAVYTRSGAEVAAGVPYQGALTPPSEDADQNCAVIRDAPAELLLRRRVYVGGVVACFVVANDGTWVADAMSGDWVVLTDTKALISLLITFVLAVVVALAVRVVEVRHAKQRAEAERMVAHAAGEVHRETLSYACHELRNPLHAVSASADFLSARMREASDLGVQVSPDDVLADVDTIQSQARAMQVLANDVLELSAVKSGHVNIVCTDIDVRAAVAGSVAMYGRSSMVPVLSDVDAEVPKAVYLDGLRLGQLLNNALSNAARWCREGSITVHVGVERVRTASLPSGVASAVGGGGGGHAAGSTHTAFASTSGSLRGSDTSIVLVAPDVDSGTAMRPSARVPRVAARRVAELHQADSPEASSDDRVQRVSSTADTADTDTEQSDQVTSMPAGLGEEMPWAHSTPQARALTRSADSAPDAKASALEATETESHRGRQASAVAMLAFSIIDTGIGLQGQDPAALFEPFVTGDSEEARRYLRQTFSHGDRSGMGTGLGLQISANLVKAMGGLISLSDNPGGRGARLKFWLPLIAVPKTSRETSIRAAGGPPAFGGDADGASGGAGVGVVVAAHRPTHRLRPLAPMSHRPAGPALSPLGSGSTASGSSAASHDTVPREAALLAGRHFLVVDDESVNRRLSLRMLKSLGCTGVALSDGDEVEPYLRKHHAELFSVAAVAMDSARDTSARAGLHGDREDASQSLAGSSGDHGGAGAAVDSGRTPEGSAYRSGSDPSVAAAAGASTTSAVTGDDGFEGAGGMDARPLGLSAILMDIEMARTRGDVACQRLRDLGVELPVCAVTGNAAPHDHERYLAAGMTAVLSKPYNATQLAAMLARVLPARSPESPSPAPGSGLATPPTSARDLARGVGIVPGR